ncbi:hypothetical protein NE237_032945 [Protea cynaroides]|uniref:Uncharacterized protein n=1 Tax=Protea cynaroides TaxID=273540 RepID=A0A9Q0R3J9_9MAGN|nr:hypothetical protein NE237_032945 [Protea cynaroides]
MRSILCVLIRRPRSGLVPELLLLQLLKTTMYPNVETHVGAHQIFAVILVPSSNSPRHDLAEKDSAIVERHGNDTQDDLKDRESGYEEWKQGWALKNLPNFYKISCSIIDRTAGPACLTEAEPKITKLSEDQTLYLIASCFKVDPFLGIGDDLQLYIKLQADVREYGSGADHQATFHESDRVILDILVGSLSRATELDAEDLVRQLSVAFTPDDAIIFAPQSVFDLDHLQTNSLLKESLSLDGRRKRKSHHEEIAELRSLASETELVTGFPDENL